MYDFQALNQALDIKSVARDYGLQVNHSGFVKCPFHNEETASLKLYDNNFFCFGCGRSGDAISLVAGIKGISQSEAYKELNESYNLCISAVQRSKEKQRNVSLKCAGWREESLDCLAWYCRVCAKVLFRSDVCDEAEEAYWIEYAKARELHQAILELPPLESYQRFRRDISIYERLFDEFSKEHCFAV